jgi:hypothetical protein
MFFFFRTRKLHKAAKIIQRRYRERLQQIEADKKTLMESMRRRQIQYDAFYVLDSKGNAYTTNDLWWGSNDDASVQEELDFMKRERYSIKNYQSIRANGH